MQRVPWPPCNYCHLTTKKSAYGATDKDARSVLGSLVLLRVNLPFGTAAQHVSLAASWGTPRLQTTRNIAIMSLP